MTLDKATELATGLQVMRPDIWTRFEVQQEGKADDTYMVKRIRFCMVELVAR